MRREMLAGFSARDNRPGRQKLLQRLVCCLLERINSQIVGLTDGRTGRAVRWMAHIYSAVHQLSMPPQCEVLSASGLYSVSFCSARSDIERPVDDVLFTVSDVERNDTC